MALPKSCFTMRWEKRLLATNCRLQAAEQFIIRSISAVFRLAAIIMPCASHLPAQEAAHCEGHSYCLNNRQRKMRMEHVFCYAKDLLNLDRTNAEKMFCGICAIAC